MKTYIKPVATIADVDLQEILQTIHPSQQGVTGPGTKQTTDWEYEEDDFEDGW